MALDGLAQADSRLDRLLLVASDLDRAEQQDIVLPLADSDDGFTTGPAGRAYLPVLRDRLFRLGYLRVRQGPDRVDEPLTRAVRRMQAEAGLTVDGWVGTQTWSALQELFAFEPTTYLERWIGAKGMTLALRRAICLRLISLGFVRDRTTATIGPVDEALAEWRQVLTLLRAPGIDAATPTESLNLIAYLFDIDRLSGLVDAAAARIAPVMDRQGDADGELLRRFASCLLKIELWLLGYEQIRPDGKPVDISRETRTVTRGVGPKGRRRRHEVQVDSAAYQLIQRFWQDSGYQGVHGSEGAILLQCFRLLTELDAQTAEDPDAERAQRVTGVIRQMEQEQLNDAEHWKQHGFLARVWDGIKRVWRFLKRLVQGAATRIRLLVRAAYQLAADGFSLVRRAMRVFSDGMAMLVDGEIAGSNHHVAMRHTADFDFQVYLGSPVAHDAVAEFLAGLRRRLANLRAAVGMLALLVRTALAAVRLASGPWGWWRLLRTLIDVNRAFDEDDRQALQTALAA